MFIKPDVSAGSYGIQVDSVCYERASAEKKINQLVHGLHGQNYAETGVLAESIIEGREFTVLLVEDQDAAMGFWAAPACERVFDKRVPAHEHFLAFERYWVLPEEDRRLPPGEPYYWYELADARLQGELTDIARRAMRAVKGLSYTRVDVRSDSAGDNLFVPEVNSQCGLSENDSASVGSMLRLSEIDIVDVISRIVVHGMARGACI